MDITSFLSIGIVGVGLSVLVQFIKEEFKLTGNKAKILVIVLSVLFAGVYYAFFVTGFLETFMQILGMATVVYSFILKKK